MQMLAKSGRTSLGKEKEVCDSDDENGAEKSDQEWDAGKGSVAELNVHDSRGYALPVTAAAGTTGTS